MLDDAPHSLTTCCNYECLLQKYVLIKQYLLFQKKIITFAVALHLICKNLSHCYHRYVRQSHLSALLSLVLCSPDRFIHPWHSHPGSHPGPQYLASTVV